jgi:excisionase family DNA binding protein
MTTKQEKTLTRKEAADSLGVSLRTLSTMMAAGKIRYRKDASRPNGAVRFDDNDIAAFLAKREKDWVRK